LNWLDYLIAILLLLGAIRGAMKGFAVSVTSFLALYVALFLGFRLMHRAASFWAEQFDLQTAWLPFLGFLTVFVLVLVGVLLLGKLLDRMFKAVALGLLNRLAGAVFGFLQFGFAIGLLLWLVDQVQLIEPNTKYESMLYEHTTAYTQQLLDWGTAVLPVLGDVLGEIDGLFDKLIEPKETGDL
jgi:membrane protein required for colicin V production